MENITAVAQNSLPNATIAQASQIAARNDPATLAKEFVAEIERAKAAQATSTPPLDMSAGKTEVELLNGKADDPNFVLTQGAAQPAPSPQTLPSGSTPPPQTSTDAFNGQKDIKLPPPANDNDTKASPLGIGGRAIRGLGFVGLLIEATRFDVHQINIEGRPDLKATWTLDRVQDTHKLDISDAATGKHLTTLPVENTNGQNWAVKDANGETIGEFDASIVPHSKGTGTLSTKALDAIDQRKRENTPATAAAKDAPTQAPTQPEKPNQSPTERHEHGFVTNTEAETNLVSAMLAQGKSQSEIQAALESLRASKTPPKANAKITHKDGATIEVPPKDPTKGAHSSTEHPSDNLTWSRHLSDAERIAKRKVSEAQPRTKAGAYIRIILEFLKLWGNM